MMNALSQFWAYLVANPLALLVIPVVAFSVWAAWTYDPKKPRWFDDDGGL